MAQLKPDLTLNKELQNFTLSRFLVSLTLRRFKAVWLMQWNSACHFTFVNPRLYLRNLKITAINGTGTDAVQSTGLAAHTNQSSPEPGLVGSSPVVLLFVL